MKRLIFFLLAYFLYFALFANDGFTGKVQAVIDGNTLVIETTNEVRHTIYLTGIDCPELGQEFGDHAKAYLEKLALQKEVEFTITGKDRWGNHLAMVTIKGIDIRIELLSEGLAWTAERNPLPALESVKESARQHAKGLWQQENPTPPWTYRRQQTMLQAKGS
jgi:micrococcal nuclease